MNTIGIVEVAALAASAAGSAIAAINGGLAGNQLGRQRRQSFVLIFRPPAFDRDILPLDVTGLSQPLAERGDELSVSSRRSAAEESDYRHPPLLRARGERPRRRTAKQCDEVAASHHSITSSARPSSGSGKVSPSAFTALRLRISSTFTARWTASSAGFSPLSIRPV